MMRAGGAALAALFVLGACSGGGDSVFFVESGDRPAGDPSFVPGTQATAELLLLAFEGDGATREGAGTVAFGTGAVSGALIAGTLNDARTRIDLAGGGWIALTDPAITEYVRVVSATPAGGTPFFGVLGIPSLPSDLPVSGGVSYSGRAALVAVDPLSVYDLSGTARIAADFGAGRVRIELDGLGGTAQGIAGGGVAPAAVPATGRIVIADSVISGARFSGGTATSSGLPFFLSAYADAGGTAGAFFGPGADEVGGRIAIVDATADTQVLGTFVAE